MDRLEQLKQRIDKFNKDRDWDQFHTPSNLSKSISIEANELLECFQWSDTNYNIEEVKEELADVMNYCIQMSLVLNVDIIDIFKCGKDKIEFMINKIDKIISISVVKNSSYDFTVFDSNGDKIVYNNTQTIVSIDDLKIFIQKDIEKLQLWLYYHIYVK